MVNKGEFFLKGYSINKDSIEFSFDGLQVGLRTNPGFTERFEELTSELSLNDETSILTIAGQTDHKKLRDIAVDLKNLLSIAVGKRVTFDRQIFSTERASELVEIEMSKNGNEGEQIVPDFEIGKYLATTLPVWARLSKEQKNDIFTITDYLNQTRHDFVEDRILRTVQAWECSAFSWTHEQNLPPDLVDLKERIKAVYRQWKKERDYKDVDGELGGRLTAALDQEKLMIRLDRLLSESGLKLDRINLDLKTLKNLRDQVAHTGRMTMNGVDALKYLQPGIKGLQLILLRRLGFDGKVIGEKDGWKIKEDIKVYFE
jgi:hypothetical protein